MFLYIYLKFLLEAIVLWFIIIRITKSDEASLEWWDVALWLFWSLLASLATGGLSRVAGLPDLLALFLALATGVAVLAWILKRQYGGDKTAHILVIYVIIRVIFALPRILPLWQKALSVD